MKHIVLMAALALPIPAFAQDDGDIDEGFSLMEQGAKLLFRGILNEMEPAIDDFAGMALDLEPTLQLFASEMGPALMDLMQTLDSVRYYDAPEMLPNGDIIIRRRLDAPEFSPPAQGDVIDL